MTHIFSPKPCMQLSPMESLSAELLKAGFDGGIVRLSFLVEWLHGNDVKVISDLDGLSRADLEDTHELSEVELVFLERLGADRWSRASLPSRHTSSPKKRGYLQGERRSYQLKGATGKLIEGKLKATDTFDVTGTGPLAMVNFVGTQLNTGNARTEWLSKARACALAGSCPKSHPSVISGLRCYQRFADKVLGHCDDELPPKIDELLAWSTLFRCSKTFGNSLNYVRLGCELVNVATTVFDDGAKMLQRAKRAIEKKRKFIARGQMFLRLEVVKELLALADGIEPWRPLAMLFLTSYVFLLRVPSEGLPITVNHNGSSDGKALISVEDEAVVLRLTSRKNRPQGSTLKRGCWCGECEATCPVHVLGAWYKALPHGSRAFVGITAASALADLRNWLHRLEVPEAEKYRLHDFRRGHCRDLQASGATLATILAAGEWRSPAFLSYLDSAELENDAVSELHVDAHLANSSDEDV